MIKQLDHANQKITEQIYHIFQRAYRAEAQLIGAVEFPPLSRTAQDIKNANTQFYGFVENDMLVAVLEMDIQGEKSVIDSLTVDPRCFRKGIAGKLLGFILAECDGREIVVETAVNNKPAINLYKKYGFVECKRWLTAHGIQKLAMSVTACR